MRIMKGKMSQKMSVCFFLLVISVSILSVSSARGQSPPEVTVAPTGSPPPGPAIPSMTLDEIRAMISQNGYTFSVGETWVSNLPPSERARLLGYVPPPMDLSYLTVSEGVRQFPAQFDYRNSGDVTPPKNQGSCGSCWAFAAIGEMESRVLIQGGPAHNLSEENVLSCNYYNAGCGGGNDFIAANHLAQFGASLETCAPYDGVDGTACRQCVTVSKLCEWRIIGTNLHIVNAANLNAVKQALTDYGPLLVTMDASDPAFSAYIGGVYEWWPAVLNINHAVLLIGWDDTAPHSHGTGAWIVKNSWGTSWGEGGYFRIAYGAAGICANVSALPCTRGPYYKEKVHYYDERGWQGSFYAQQYDTYGAVRFVPTTNGTLERVEFWAVDDNLLYQIRVYDTRTGSGAGPYTFSGLLSSQSGSVNKAGYYSVELATKPVITAGNDFTITVRFNTPDFQYPVPMDASLPISGQSYYSADGTTWWNLSLSGNPWDIGIRGVVKGLPRNFSGYPGYFNIYSFFVAGDTAYCTDVLGSSKIAFGLEEGGALENPEGRTDLILTSTEHDTGNLMIVGGPAVNPVADEFDNAFNITYNNNPPVSFEIFVEGHSIYLDLVPHPGEDICLIYLGEHNNRNVLIVWGYGWWGTYAGSVFMGDPANWQGYPNAHLLLLRWVDTNFDGLVQFPEIIVETFA